LSLKGKIVDVKGTKANDILSKLKELQRKGSLVKYVGRNSVSNLQIQSFSTSHPYTNAGGADFDMTLKEIRIAKSAYNKSTNTAKKTQEQKKNSPDLSVGSIVVFKGGSVYVSSDATKPAATRGRSTCKITIINTRSWSKHSYHLISTDGGRVYGWVDKSNIEGVPSSGTAAKTNGGTQQIKKSTSAVTTTKTTSGKLDVVYYTVKKGDTALKLVTTTFKEYGLTVKDLMDANPSAFSGRGIASTLKVGARLMIAKKSTHTSSSGTKHGGGGGKF
jgi:LysM repeat protein